MKRTSSTKKETNSNSNSVQKFHAAKSVIGNMLHMNESEYTVYTEKALKGSVKVHYLLPLMNRWRKEKKAALNSVGTGCDDLEAKDSQRLGSHDESQSQGNDVEGSNVGE